jgi:hypothetical protein
LVGTRFKCSDDTRGKRLSSHKHAFHKRDFRKSFDLTGLQCIAERHPPYRYKIHRPWGLIA